MVFKVSKPDFPENGVSLIEAVGEKKTPVVNINASEGVKHAIILADYDSKVRMLDREVTSWPFRFQSGLNQVGSWFPGYILLRMTNLSSKTPR